MDFSAWFEVWLDGRWYVFDARHNQPRVGRIVMARGRDAADVAMISSFGAHTLVHFQVWTDEVEPKAVPRLPRRHPAPLQAFPPPPSRSVAYG